MIGPFCTRNRGAWDGETNMRATRTFLIIGTVLLLWNLMGVAALVMQYGADLDQLARTDPDTARAFAAMPLWAWAVYAIAVGAGTLGAIALLMRKAVAASLFLLSLIAVIIQFGYTFLGTDLLHIKGWTAAVFPAVIFLIAVGQWLFARSMAIRRVLR